MKHITESIVKYKEYKEELKNGKSQGLLTPYSNLNSKLKNELKEAPKYIGTIEYQENGRIHFHVIYFNLPYIILCFKSIV